MTTSLDHIASLLDDAGVRYQRHQGHLMATFSTSQDDDPYGVAFFSHLDGQVFEATCVGILPTQQIAASEHKPMFLMYLLDVAWTTPFGTPEVDKNDGELRLLAEVPLADAQMTVAQLRLIVDGLLRTAARIRAEGAQVLATGQLPNATAAAQARADAAAVARTAVMQLIQTAQGRQQARQLLADPASDEQLRAAVRDMLPLIAALEQAQGDAVPAAGATPPGLPPATTQVPASPSATAASPATTGPAVPAALDWNHPLLQGTGVVSAWARELRDVLAAHPEPREPLPDALLQVGRGAVLETDNEQVALACAERVAADLGLPFVPTTADNLVETLVALRQAPRRVVAYLAGDLPWLLAGSDEAEPQLLPDDAFQGEKLQALASQPAGRVAVVRSLLCHHDLPALIMMTCTADLGQFSEVLSRPGLFDRRFGLPRLTPAILGQRFLSELGEAVCGPTLREHPAKVEFLLAGASRQRRQTMIHQLRRLSHRLGRPLEFSDLVSGHHAHFVEREAPPAPSKAERQARTLVAYHEAGHAVMAMIASGGREIPEHATIVATGMAAGFVLSNMDMLMAGHDTYAKFCSRVRTTLAGRAAEDVVFDPEAITTGAHGDLASVTEMAMRYFARAGFGPAFTQPEGRGANLAVWDTDNPHLRSELHQMVRCWLAEEYATVKSALQVHRALLDATAQALLHDPVQDQAELRALWERFR